MVGVGTKFSIVNDAGENFLITRKILSEFQHFHNSNNVEKNLENWSKVNSFFRCFVQIIGIRTPETHENSSSFTVYEIINRLFQGR